jgi:nucleoside-diphosphate-sugar epimerase
MKNVLVTGACGFVGSELVRQLLEKGYKVRATDLPTADWREMRELGVEIMPADFTKPETLPEVVKDQEIIFNPASLFNYSSPMDAMLKVNVEGIRNLCEAVLKYDTKLQVFVHWSTLEVCGYNMFDAVYLTPDQQLTEEYSNLTPGDSPYAKSKYLQELEIWRYHRERGLPVIVLRLATIYGTGKTRKYLPEEKTSLVAKLFNLFIDLTSLRAIPKSVLNWRWPLVHVEDAAGSAIFLSEKKEAIGQIYNVVDDGCPMWELLYALGERLGIEVKDLPMPPISEVWRVVGKYLKGDLPIKVVDVFYRTLVKELEERGGRVWMQPDYLVSYTKLIFGMKEWADNFRASNEKLKRAGYRFKYRNILQALDEILEEFKRRGWLVKNPGLAHLLKEGLYY